MKFPEPLGEKFVTFPSALEVTHPKVNPVVGAPVSVMPGEPPEQIVSAKVVLVIVGTGLISAVTGILELRQVRVPIVRVAST